MLEAIGQPDDGIAWLTNCCNEETQGDFAEAIIGTCIIADGQKHAQSSTVAWRMPRKETSTQSARDILMIVAAVQDMSSHWYEHAVHWRSPLRWAQESMLVHLDGTLSKWYSAHKESSGQKSAEGGMRRRERDTDRVANFKQTGSYHKAARHT